jgi:hypothetical protein
MFCYNVATLMEQCNAVGLRLPLASYTALVVVAFVGGVASASVPRRLLPTQERASHVRSGLSLQASTFSLIPAGSGLVVRCLTGEGFTCTWPLFNIEVRDVGAVRLPRGGKSHHCLTSRQGRSACSTAAARPAWCGVASATL